ncbi:zinc ABC transporter substrate-binding protein [Marinobacter sp. M1N3S26]|uniref:zinc ABC transporter substrate-binding protein n=1 Tax=Marinobacter sp. M1N3S26 TaxID=3382299 RepID=UPI00387B6977
MLALPSLRSAVPAIIVLLLWSCLASASADTPQVVTSLKPVELLVRAVAHDQVEVTTLVPAGSSPHTYQLRPSERRQLAAADRVFWVGPGMETFLTRLLTGPDLQDRSVALAPEEQNTQGQIHDEHEHHDEEHGHGDAESEHHESHGHEQAHDHHGHSHGEGEDPHIWLDPALAITMAETIAGHLKELDGVDAGAIDRNLASFTHDLQAREASIREQLAPARELDLFTYHDAFGRFAEHYGLAIAGVLTLSPERTPGARHLAEVQNRLNRAEQACLMIEPQFDRQWWQSLMGDVELPISVWDPLASDIPATPQGYLDFQQSMAAAVLNCLPEKTE